MQEKKSRGRPAGSGAQLPPAERAKKSRSRLAAAGAIRLDCALDAQANAHLAKLMRHWGCATRKEAITRAIKIASKTIG